MFYIYKSFSIAGWIAAAVFFAFLLGWYLLRGRVTAEPRGFDVTPSAPPADAPTTTTTTALQTDAKRR